MSRMDLFQSSTSFLALMISFSAITTSKGTPNAIDARAQSISRGVHNGVAFANFKAHKFSYLNVTALGADYVINGKECGLACALIPSCFSFNLAAVYDINGRVLCELLPSDKYNNSDKFISSQLFHHYSIGSPCMSEPCENGGTCVSIYEKNSYVCLCTKGFTGSICQTDIDECASDPCKNNGTCTDRVNGFNCSCAPRFMGAHCETVCKAVGVSNTGIILDSQITASSVHGSSSYKPYYGRLHDTRGDGWCSGTSNSNNDWLQIDFGKTIQVCGVATMGDVTGDEWTTVFKLSFSTDGNAWKMYRDKQNVEMEFRRHGDSNTVDYHNLPAKASARFIRFHPINRHRWNCLRVEVYS